MEPFFNWMFIYCLITKKKKLQKISGPNWIKNVKGPNAWFTHTAGVVRLQVSCAQHSGVFVHKDIIKVYGSMLTNRRTVLHQCEQLKNHCKTCSYTVCPNSAKLIFMEQTFLKGSLQIKKKKKIK